MAEPPYFTSTFSNIPAVISAKFRMWWEHKALRISKRLSQVSQASLETNSLGILPATKTFSSSTTNLPRKLQILWGVSQRRFVHGQTKDDIITRGGGFQNFTSPSPVKLRASTRQNKRVATESCIRRGECQHNKLLTLGLTSSNLDHQANSM